jgi:hypothetical protein
MAIRRRLLAELPFVVLLLSPVLNSCAAIPVETNVEQFSSPIDVVQYSYNNIVYPDLSFTFHNNPNGVWSVTFGDDLLDNNVESRSNRFDVTILSMNFSLSLPVIPLAIGDTWKVGSCTYTVERESKAMTVRNGNYLPLFSTIVGTCSNEFGDTLALYSSVSGLIAFSFGSKEGLGGKFLTENSFILVGNQNGIGSIDAVGNKFEEKVSTR